MALLMMVYHGSSIGTKPKEHSWGLMLLRFQEYEETARLSFQAIDTPVAVCVTEALFTAGLGASHAFSTPPRACAMCGGADCELTQTEQRILLLCQQRGSDIKTPYIGGNGGGGNG